MRNKILVVFTCLFSLFLYGCGYSTASLIKTGARTIHVENIVNKINIHEELTDRRQYIAYRSGMEMDITRSIIERFIRDGNLRIGSPANADLLMSGELIDFTREVLRYDRADNPEEYRINVVVNLKVTDPKKDEIILDRKNLTGQFVYRTVGSYARSEYAAIDMAINDLSTRAVNLVIESW